MLEEALEGLPDLATLEPDPHGRRGHLYDPETDTVYHVGAEVIAEFNRVRQAHVLAATPDMAMLEAARAAGTGSPMQPPASQEAGETQTTEETTTEAGAKKAHAGK